MLHEELDGGVPDQTVSTEMDRLKELVRLKDDMTRDSLSIRVDAKTKSSQGGVLERIFGSSMKELPGGESK